MASFTLPSGHTSPTSSADGGHHHTMNNGNGSNSDNDNDLFLDRNNLPFPLPLPRNAFLSPGFHAPDYLAALSHSPAHRHQSLADLHDQLASRSQLVAAELQSLVNDEYAAFLALGAQLSGGGEAVEGVRVGAMGFVRSVDAIRRQVRGKRRELEALIEEKRALAGQIARGRDMLAVGERVEELERAVEEPGAQNDAAEEAVDEDEEEEGGVTERLQKSCNAYKATREQVLRLGGQDHPYMARLLLRLQAVRKSLLLDLATALKLDKGNKDAGPMVVDILNLYTVMDEAGEALVTIKKK